MENIRDGTKIRGITIVPAIQIREIIITRIKNEKDWYIFNDPGFGAHYLYRNNHFYQGTNSRYGRSENLSE
jgi:hypothetical protein